MIQLAKKYLKDHRIGLILISSGLLFYNWFLVSFFPTIKKLNIDELLKQYPKEILAFFGGTQLPFSSFEGFVNGEFYSLMSVLIVGGFLITIATSEFTKEVETGTIETLLSLPITRGKVYLTKWLNIMLTAALMAVFTVMGTAVFGKLYHIAFSMKAFYLTTILTVLFFWTIAAFTIMVSVIFNERSKPIFISIALLAIGYMINSLANVVNAVKDFRFLAIFHYYDTARALAEKEIGLTSIAVFLGVIILSSAFGYFWFKNRDFAP